MLWVRIFPFVSFTHGILSHLLLREENDQYLRQTKEMPRYGKGAAGYSLTWRHFLFGRAKIPRNFGQGGVRSWAQLLSHSFSALEERQAPVAVERIRHDRGVLSPAAFSYCEWSSACGTSHCTRALLTPYLTGKDPRHLLGCLRGKPGTLSPFPIRGSCSLQC